MTRDLLIVSERALTAGHLAAAVSAVHQGKPWKVSQEDGRLAVNHHDRPLLLVSASARHDEGSRSPWHTRLTVVGDDEPLALEVVRAVAWEAGGEVHQRGDAGRWVDAPTQTWESRGEAPDHGDEDRDPASPGRTDLPQAG